MKFSLIATLIVALAIGSQAASLVKRQADDYERLSTYIHELTQKMNTITDDPEMARKGREFMAAGRPDLWMQTVEEYLKPISSKIEELARKMNLPENSKITAYPNTGYSHPFFSWWK